MDKIIIKGLRVFAYHGVNPEEKQNGQPFELDVAASCDLRCAGQTDDLNDTVSYAKIAKIIARVMAEQSCDLLERAAQRVADAVLAECPSIQDVEVLLKKPEAPVKLDFDYMAVSILRTRGDLYA